MAHSSFSRRALLKGAASAAALLTLPRGLGAETESIRTPRSITPGDKLNLACEGGTIYIGDKGVVYNGRLLPESRMRDHASPPKTMPHSPEHYQEWLLACKGGEPAGSNFDVAGPQAETVLLGNIALRTRKKLRWDAASLITNVPEANELLRKKYRDGWGV